MTRNRRRCLAGDRCEPQTFAEAVYCVVHHSAADAKTLAERIGVRHGYLLDAANPDRDDIAFQGRHLIPLTLASRNDALLAYLCREAGGVYLSLPSPGGVDGAITQAHLKTVTQFGEQASKLAEILADDRIERHEKTGFDQQSNETIRAIGELNAIVQAHDVVTP